MKQDVTYSRTAAELEAKYMFEKRFAEIMGVASGARVTAQQAAEKAARTEAELSFRLAVTVDEEGNEKIISRLTATVDEMQISGNKLVVESDNFILWADGSITATSGMLSYLQVNECEISECKIKECTIDDCVINDTCKIKGTLTASTIHSALAPDGSVVGSITAEIVPFLNGAYYAAYNIVGQDALISISRKHVALTAGNTIGLYVSAEDGEEGVRVFGGLSVDGVELTQKISELSQEISSLRLRVTTLEQQSGSGTPSLTATCPDCKVETEWIYNRSDDTFDYYRCRECGCELAYEAVLRQQGVTYES